MAKPARRPKPRKRNRKVGDLAPRNARAVKGGDASGVAAAAAAGSAALGNQNAMNALQHQVITGSKDEAYRQSLTAALLKKLTP